MISGMVVPETNTAPNEAACSVEGIEIYTPPKNASNTRSKRAGRDLILCHGNADFTCKFPFLLSNVKWYSFDFELKTMGMWIENYPPPILSQLRGMWHSLSLHDLRCLT